jgi:uncharacterized protein (TIGR02452 family)
MKRSTRADQASETVAVVERGSYRTASGRVVDIARPVHECLNSTRYYTPEELNRLRKHVLGQTVTGHPTVFELVNETTLSGIARVLSRGQGPVAALNFASARNPGGGFLNGSHAQEESLARSSALYASQLRAGEFYERHRASSSMMYSDAMILSPDCPIIRDDDGRLLDEPQMASFITSAAPNAGAAAGKRREDLSAIPDVFRRRSEYVLALAASQGYRQLVLGAWGCGVFRNDPEVVAESFASHLRHGLWAGRFDRVVFSVLDTSASQTTFKAFQSALNG